MRQNHFLRLISPHSAHARWLVCLLALGGGRVQAAADLSVSLRGTTAAVQGGQLGYIVDITNVASGTVNNATGATLNVTLPAGLTDVFWDCLALGSAATSCGTNTTGTQTGTSLSFAGLSIAAGSTDVIRLTAQGRVPTTTTGTLSGSAQITVPGDANTTNNSRTISTAVANFPDLCLTGPQIQRQASNVTSLAWPLDDTITVTRTVSGSQSSLTSGAGTQSFQAYAGIELSSTPSQQRIDGSFVYTLSFSRPVPVNQLFLSIADVNVNNPTITLEVTGGATPADFAPISASGERPTSAPAPQVLRPLAYDSVAGRMYRQVDNSRLNSGQDSSTPPTVRGTLGFLGTGTNLVSTVTLRGTGGITGDLVAFLYGAQVRCPVYTVTKAVSTPFVQVTDNNGAVTVSPTQLTYTLTVRNTGSAPGTNVTTTDTLPAGLTYVSSTGSPTNVQASPTSPVTFVLPTLAIGATQTYTITAQPTVAARTQQAPLLNTATTRSNDYRSVAASTAQVRTDVIYSTLGKQVRNVTRGGSLGLSAAGLPGEILEYCLEATNYGSLALSGYTVYDSLPMMVSPDLSAYGSGTGIQLTRGGTTTSLTSASDGDAGTLSETGGTDNAGALQLLLGSFASAESARGCFQTTIK